MIEAFFQEPAYVWLGIGLLLIAFEAAFASFMLIGPGLAAVLVAILCAVFEIDSLLTQLTLWALTSIGLTVAVRAAYKRLRANERPNMLNNRAGRLIGRRYRIAESFVDDDAVIDAEGARWRVIAEDGEPLDQEEMVEVTTLDGAKLVVRRVEAPDALSRRSAQGRPGRRRSPFSRRPRNSP